VYNGHEPADEHWMNTGPSVRTAETIDEERVMEIINRLPAVTREVFNLFAIDGYAHKEIAAMLDISENTSKWHVHDARRRIREVLQPKPKKETLS
jgi:RNA polymerase sigma-70 factor (ECF subfamily)